MFTVANALHLKTINGLYLYYGLSWRVYFLPKWTLLQLTKFIILPEFLALSDWSNNWSRLNVLFLYYFAIGRRKERL
jgi:hypothetical protein